MCGIAGFLGIGGHDERALVQRMCAAIVHRGPDDEGYAVDSGVALGMRRLAIVDIAHGKQPMASDDGAVELVFNGEIYNAPALRASMQAEGVAFRTRSDTEVVLRLFERDPEDVERHLAGMWAIAVHDRRRRRVILSRDRFGIKPLFVADAGGALAFASELTCLAPLRGEVPFARTFELDRAAAHAMLSWGYIPEQATPYRGVTRLAPGCRLEIDLASGRRDTRRYYRVQPSAEASRVKDLPEACELVSTALRRSVREHLESDVPLAAFVSGGVDSSLVAAYAAEGPLEVRAFCVGFREPRFDESPYARQVADRLGLKIDVTVLDEAHLRGLLADALAAYDEPFGDSSSLATFALSRVVSRTHKVALAGDGGDEVFAGYKKYRIVPMRERLGRIPFARRALARVLRALPVRVDRTRGWTEALRTARRVASGLTGDDASAYVALTQVASLDATASLVASDALAARFVDEARERFVSASGGQLARTLAADLGSVLPNDMLTKVDRASMACSLEVRVPFLDHRVVELGLGLPDPLLLGARGKAVPKALFAARFGDALANRPKHGFGVPVEKWLREDLSPACDALFASARLERYGVLSPKALGEGAWRRVLARSPQVLWHVFAFAAWCEVALGEGPGALRELLRRP